MNIIFLASARNDLVWFRHYYERVFPEGAARAQVHYRKSLTLLRRHPFAGSLDMGGYRRLPISRTPFTLVYRTRQDSIEVLHIRDGRSNRAEPPPSSEN